MWPRFVSRVVDIVVLKAPAIKRTHNYQLQLEHRDMLESSGVKRMHFIIHKMHLLSPDSNTTAVSDSLFTAAPSQVQ